MSFETATVVSLLLLVLTVKANLPPNCGRRTRIENNRIVDGFMAGGAYGNNSNAPWHVALFSSVRDRLVSAYKCGGSLLTDRVVLTSAHCVWNTALRAHHPVERFTVQAGAYHPKLPHTIGLTREPLPVQVRQLSEIYVNGDLALLQLRSPVLFDWYIQPICVPPASHAVPSGDVGLMAGWGSTPHHKSASTDLKVLENVPLLDRQRCLTQSNVPLDHLLTEKRVCGGFTNGQIMCPGDDGGALAMPSFVADQEVFYVYGVVGDMSQQNPECDRDEYTVLANVQAYSDWILGALDQIEYRMSEDYELFYHVERD